MRDRLALHTWTLDALPLHDVLRIARATGWSAVELRRLDFLRAVEAGGSAEDVVDLVKGSGLAVSAVGAQFGWMFADGAERRRLLLLLGDSCRWAAALGCRTVMSPVDRGPGDLAQAARSIREAGDIAAEHGVRLALEPNSQAEQLNTLEVTRELLSRAAHPACALLVDTYHLGRRGGGVPSIEAVAVEEIGYVQFSDVPAQGLRPGQVLDRLPPGRGTLPFREIFRLLSDKGYRGYLSYEAPNQGAWARDPEAVAREAIEATRSLLPL